MVLLVNEDHVTFAQAKTEEESFLFKILKKKKTLEKYWKNTLFKILEWGRLSQAWDGFQGQTN